MRCFSGVHDLGSSDERAKKGHNAKWVIPVAFFLATIVSFAIGIVVPAALGPANPWLDQALRNHAGVLARADSDHYLEGLAKVTGARYGLHSDFGAPAPSSSAKAGQVSCL